ncbi:MULTISPECIES: hypothetical protein [Aliivibrio]|jgi:MFS superfamily sulfate permease-like transporter|uniref:Uncharacterized protein n=3 Tax=Aliivibrio TaxID=511678 RepID=A0A1B9NVU4_ALILO|nr:MULTISPECIES: hypothetical protein [Aliivibrio]AZL86033.1 hypothetical protein EIJ81_16940 [Aliivibrio salmonicida]AZL86098.1 hypothetical protein EIJ81_17310 [Aliivibrio salmonicida]MBB1313256.1 hypothetical protein [Aliivibrio sp. SR45-2]OCH18710.1 hypothetical protein A6E04_02470 [Aliivibrio logei]OEF13380.1 hypothetical protein A1Q5_08280 [Aliivibrio logei 5S-186]
MLTQIDRLTIYCVLCFVTICSLVFSTPNTMSLFPLISLASVMIALTIELKTWSESEAIEDKDH